MPQISLRIATPEDAAAVTELLENSYPPLMSPSYDGPNLGDALLLMTRANPALLASGRFHVAVSAEHGMVGCGGWSPERPGTTEVEPGLGHVRHFATMPEWIGQGIGRAIYGRCESQASAEGLARFECYSSYNAVGFYEALGFTRVRQIDVPLAEHLTLPGILMERSI